MRAVVRFVVQCWLVVACTAMAEVVRARDVDVIIVRGADGAPEYAKRFDAEVSGWQAACAKSKVSVEVLTQLDELKAALQKQSSKPTGALWLVLIGHGTFDGRDARFNLSGPDFTPQELAQWLKSVQREVVVVNTASASGAFIKPLAGPKRVLLSATKSGDEVSYPRFGEHLARAIGGELQADLDQDQQVSLLEAFLYASRQTAQFYETEGRIATEHALIEDNGDGVGTRAEMFEGVRAKADKADGGRASQIALLLNAEEASLSDEIRAKRDALEVQVRALVARKTAMKEDDFYRELESLFVAIATLHSM